MLIAIVGRHQAQWETCDAINGPAWTALRLGLALTAMKDTRLKPLVEN